MSDDKKPMQADGGGTRDSDRVTRGQMASDSDAPKPETDEADDDDEREGEFKGGQSNQAYYGSGQLGEKKVGETHNAPSDEE
jgi:hypothetical protein